MDKDTMMKVIAYLKALPNQMMAPTSTASPLPPNAAPTYAGSPAGQGAAGNAADILRQQKAMRDAQLAAAGG
jgi:hypothetical protein